MTAVCILSRAPYHEGPTSFKVLCKSYLAAELDVAVIASIVGGLFFGCMAGTFSDGYHLGLPLSITIGVATGWFWFSLFYFWDYATKRWDDSSSLVWLPYNTFWAWSFLVMTLPWAPIYLLSAVRLILTWKKSPELE